MIPLHDLTIKKFHEGLVKREFKALEIVEGYFQYIEEKDKEVGAYLTLLNDEALKQAEAADIKIATGEAISPLLGVPLAIKDNILIRGHRATAGSQILKNYISSYDAGVVKKLREVGAVFLGKTNLDEFAMGSSTENSSFQKTKNPHDLTRVPGGSSGGSAAAIAGHMALGGLGSDTGGSIRQPAAFCGVVGLKPTYGAVSRHGLIAMASSLDQIGPITRTVHDAAIMFQSIALKDEFDATSVDASSFYGSELLHPKLEVIKDMIVGLPEEYFLPGLNEDVRKAVEEAIQRLKTLGLRFVPVNLPHTKYALSTYYIVMPAEVSANLSRFDGIRYERHEQATNLLDLYTKNKGKGFGSEAKRRIILGAFVLSSGYYDAYYAKAQRVRALIKQDFVNAFKTVDVILTPVTPTPPFKFGEKMSNPLDMYLSDVFTIPANLAGVPAISIPVHSSYQLPIGFQLIGKPWHEADLLSIGQFYENISNSK